MPFSVMLLPTTFGSQPNMRCPEAVAQDHDRRLAGLVVFGQQQAAVQRLGARAGGTGSRTCAAPRRAPAGRARAACRCGPARSTSLRTSGSRSGCRCTARATASPAGMLMPGDRSQSTARRSGSGYGSGFSSSALTTLKIAVLAPMPMASEATITKVEPGASAQGAEGVADILQERHGVRCYSLSIPERPTPNSQRNEWNNEVKSGATSHIGCLSPYCSTDAPWELEVAVGSWELEVGSCQCLCPGWAAVGLGAARGRNTSLPRYCPSWARRRRPCATRSSSRIRAGLGADAEQPRCLIQVKGQSRHLAERANHHGDELLPAGLGDSATGLLPPLGRFVSLR